MTYSIEKMDENRFQNDRSQVKTKICDEDRPMANHLHTGLHEVVRQIEQIRETSLTPRLM